MANTFTTTTASGPTTTTDALTALATSPKKVVTDEGSVEERSAKDLIDLDKYQKAQEVTDNPLHGLRISRCIPAGPI